MAEQTALIVPASAEDVEHFARRRWRDEHSRKLYMDLARVAPNGAFVAKVEGSAIGIVVPHALEDEWFLSETIVPNIGRRGAFQRPLGLEVLGTIDGDDVRYVDVGAAEGFDKVQLSRHERAELLCGKAGG